MCPFPKNSKNPFMWNRFSNDIINTQRQGYHNGRRQGYNRYNGRYNAPYNIGIELEVANPMGEVALMPTNYFSYESDCSINAFGWGVELVSMPIPHTLARRVEMWSGVCNWLEAKGFKSWEFGEEACGLHIHIGREALGSNQNERENNLGKLVYLYNKINDNTKRAIFGRPCGRWCNSDNLRTLQAINALNGNVTKEAFNAIGNEKNAQLERYFEINTTNTHTIEFRRGRGSVNAKRIAMVVAFCDLLVEYCNKTTKVEKLNIQEFANYVKGLKKMEAHPLTTKLNEMGY